MECSNGAIMTTFGIQIDGKRDAGRPKMSWRQLTERDCREGKLSAIDPHNRDTWRSGVRSAMHAASQLPGRGATDVDIAPVPSIIKQSDDVDDGLWWFRKSWVLKQIVDSGRQILTDQNSSPRALHAQES